MVKGPVKSLSNHKLTEYFPIRRSIRKTKKEVLREKYRCLQNLVRSEIEEGLEVKYVAPKGRGVFATKDFSKGDFVVEYSGELINMLEANRREALYEKDESLGCYMYYFKYNEQAYCIDATAETGKLGRLINHSRNGNLFPKTILVDNKPRITLFAKEFIKKGEELLYDYGDRSQESLMHYPWLKE